MMTWTHAVALAGALVAAGCGTLDRAVEHIAMNRVLDPALAPCSDAKCEAEASTFIVDLHADSLMWNRDIRRARMHPVGHADFDRLIRGGVDIQVLGAPTQTPVPSSYRRGVATRTCIDRNDLDTSNLVSLFNDTTRPDGLTPKGRAFRQAERFRAWTANPKGHNVRAVLSREDLGVDNEGSPSPGAEGLAVMLSLEGMHWVRGGRKEVFADIADLKRAGYRMVALTHRFSNHLATASEDCALILPEATGGTGVDDGLTGAGFHAIAAIAQMGLILDLAHASDGTIADVAATLKKLPPDDRPAVFMSHGGVQHADCDLERNLTPDAIRDIVGLDGVIGVGFWPEALCYTKDEWEAAMTDDDREELVFGRMVTAYLAIIDAIETAPPDFWRDFGVEDPDPLDHLALGSDFDGAVLMPADTSVMPLRFEAYLRGFKCNGYVRKTLPDDLRRRCVEGASPFDGGVEKLLGSNAARNLYRGLPRTVK